MSNAGFDVDEGYGKYGAKDAAELCYAGGGEAEIATEPSDDQEAEDVEGPPKPSRRRVCTTARVAPLDNYFRAQRISRIIRRSRVVIDEWTVENPGRWQCRYDRKCANPDCNKRLPEDSKAKTCSAKCRKALERHLAKTPKESPTEYFGDTWRAAFDAWLRDRGISMVLSGDYESDPLYVDFCRDLES
jgi:hypothetical protein